MNIRKIKYYLPIPLRRKVFKTAKFWLFTLQNFLYKHNPEHHPPVFIYQMGKVGSTSLYYALRKYYPGYVVHNHSINNKPKNKLAKKHYDSFIRGNTSVKIISMVREPVSRNISAYFHSLDQRNLIKHYRKLPNPYEQIKQDFLNEYNHNYPLVWFDKHLKKDFNIDVYAYPFPKEKGFLELHRSNMSLLLMKAELSKNTKEKAVQQFLGLRKFHLKDKNIGTKSAYTKEYKTFKENIQIPADYIEKLLNSKYFKHFYNSGTASEVKKKWL